MFNVQRSMLNIIDSIWPIVCYFCHFDRIRPTAEEWRNL